MAPVLDLQTFPKLAGLETSSPPLDVIVKWILQGDERLFRSSPSLFPLLFFVLV